MDNKTTFLKTLIILLGLITGIVSVYAQEADTAINKVSLNLLAGVSAGTQGFEFGGLVNVDLGNVRGAQIAGLVNTNTGNIKGFQLAGLANTVTGSANGFQAAGIYNFVKESSNGFQLAGITNVNLQKSRVVGIGFVVHVELVHRSRSSRHIVVRYLGRLVLDD